MFRVIRNLHYDDAEKKAGASGNIPRSKKKRFSDEVGGSEHRTGRADPV